MVLVHNIELSDSSCIIRIGDLMKTSNPLFHNGEFGFAAYPQDETICPVARIREYIKRTESLRKHHDKKLLLSYTNPHNPISKDTFSR